MIFYFTGTGNTRWAAQQLAGATGDRLRFIPDELRKSTLHYTLADDERLGICFPTHGWQPPHIVREFLRRASFENVHYVYALTTCGDNMGYAMRILRKELQRHGLTLDAAFAVVMPESNVCFSFLHLDTKESEERKIAAAQERMPHITDLVAQKARILTRSSGWTLSNASFAVSAPDAVRWTTSKEYHHAGSTMAVAPTVWPATTTVPRTLSIGVTCSVDNTILIDARTKNSRSHAHHRRVFLDSQRVVVAHSP